MGECVFEASYSFTDSTYKDVRVMLKMWLNIRSHTLTRLHPWGYTRHINHDHFGKESRECTMPTSGTEYRAIGACIQDETIKSTKRWSKKFGSCLAQTKLLEYKFTENR